VTAVDAPPPSVVEVGVLIAGGGSRRAGLDKRFLVLEGRTLLVRNLAFLRSLFPEVAVVIGRDQSLDLGDEAGVHVLRDAWPGSSPLVGIATALRHFGRPVFVLAADIAFPRREAADAVIAASLGHDVAMPAGANDFRQPLFAVYGPRCLPPMARLLEAGRHRIVDIFPSVSVAEVSGFDEALFRNINTIADFESARRESTRRGAGGARPALVAIVGKSDSGKTTLIEKLVPELVRLGLRVGTVKHDAHSFEIDHPGKDSWRHGRAGAEAYVIASPERLAFITRLEGELPLTEIVARFYGGFDIVVAEGYKRSAPHRVELFRRGAGHAEPLCAPGEAIALVTDAELAHAHRFGLEDAAALARFLAVRLEGLRVY
jgi:molybdopterin-guanine dinucleotide biosynthesis protein B/molybdopterin-guanine dinucleotide biosynthesis protein